MENNAMTRQILTAAILVSLAVPALTVPAFAQPPAGQSCLRSGQIYDYTPVPGNRTLVVTDKLRQKFRVTFMAACYGLQHNFGIGFKTFGAGGLACVAKGDSVVRRDPVSPTPCLIASVQPYTAAMAQEDAALFAAARK